MFLGANMSEQIDNLQPEQPQENWTKFPNNLLDNINQFDGNEFRILGLMIRKNLGFQNPNREFSGSYVAVKIGISKPTAIKTLDSLVKRNVIKIVGTGSRGVRKYQVLWQTPLVKESNQSNNLTSTDKNPLPLPVKKLNTLKENKVKENKVKEGVVSLNLRIVNFWNKTTDQRIKLTSNRKRLISNYLKDYTRKELLYSIVNLSRDQWTITDGKKYYNIERLLQRDKADKNHGKFCFFPFSQIQESKSNTPYMSEEEKERNRKLRERDAELEKSFQQEMYS